MEKGQGDRIIGKIDAVIWRTRHVQVRRTLRASGQQISDGQQLRCRGRVDFWGPGGRLQLVVEDVDPQFTLGHLERRRRETLVALERAGLLDRNAALPLSPVPLRIGLITSEGSAAYHDFLTGLASSGFGFQVLFVHAATQGQSAEGEVASALELLGSDSLRQSLDCLVLIRGGGSRSDLAVFDSRTIATAVARCPLPVLTGLGHEIDLTIADRVSHTASKTPTMVAELLVGLVAESDHRLRTAEEALVRISRERLRRAEERLRGGERLARSAGHRLREASQHLTHLESRLGSLAGGRLREANRQVDGQERRLLQGARRTLEHRAPMAEALAHRIVAAARGRLRQAETHLRGLERLSHGLSPKRTLERGFSLTRTASGDILRHPEATAPGEVLITELAGGQVISRVEEES